ncbi:MAG: eCIS core domain-containing protein, partial [Terracidiphilus sp.]
MKRPNAHDKPANSAPPVVRDASRSSGQPLDAATRTFMEPRFGYDFSGVRVHTNARAVESARAVNAHAYTIGKDIFFDAGKFSPSTDHGRELLAHELTHVAQQRHGLSHVAPGAAQEQEANLLAKAVMRQNARVTVTQTSSVGIACAPRGFGSILTPEERAREIANLRAKAAQLGRQLAEEYERFGWYAGERRDREVEARTDKSYEAKQKLKEATENMEEIQDRITLLNKQMQETN